MGLFKRKPDGGFTSVPVVGESQFRKRQILRRAKRGSKAI